MDGQSEATGGCREEKRREKKRREERNTCGTDKTVCTSRIIRPDFTF